MWSVHGKVVALEELVTTRAKQSDVRRQHARRLGSIDENFAWLEHDNTLIEDTDV